MLYHEILDSLIKESGLSLKAISMRCGELGVSVSPTYISRLRSGDQVPATLKVNEALARACGANEHETAIFLWEGYRPDMEKSAPGFVVKYFAIQNGLAKRAFNTHVMPDLEEEDRQAYLDQLERSKGQPFIALSMHGLADGISEEHYKSFDLFIEGLVKGTTPTASIAPVTAPRRRRPVMKDDSMLPLIPKGSALSARRQDEAKNGDIVIIRSAAEHHYLIRRWTVIDGEVYLVPENRAYEAVKYDPPNHSILGVVGSIEVTLWNSLV